MLCLTKRINIQCALRPLSRLPLRYTLHRPVDTGRDPYKNVVHSRHITYLRSPTPDHSSFHAQSYRYSTTCNVEADLVDDSTMASTKSNTSSGKRKRASPKFYAVRVGRTPGIYHSWEDCKAQTDGTKAECELGPLALFVALSDLLSQELPYPHRS
jgi:hypothetical protein